MIVLTVLTYLEHTFETNRIIEAKFSTVNGRIHAIAVPIMFSMYFFL